MMFDHTITAFIFGRVTVSLKGELQKLRVKKYLNKLSIKNTAFSGPNVFDLYQAYKYKTIIL